MMIGLGAARLLTTEWEPVRLHDDWEGGCQAA